MGREFFKVAFRMQAQLKEKNREIKRLRKLEAIWKQKTAANAICALNQLIARAEKAEKAEAEVRRLQIENDDLLNRITRLEEKDK